MDYNGGERPTEAPPTIEDNVRRYAGVYWPTRAEYTTAGKMVRLLRSISVRPGGGHRLLVSVGFPAQAAGQYAEVAPGIFRASGGVPPAFGDIVFQSDDEGHAGTLYQQNNPGTAYVKAPWYATPQFNLALLGMVVVSFLSVLFWAPVGWWIRRSYKETVAASLRLAAWWQVLLSATGMLFLVGFAAVFSNPEVVFGLSTGARAVFLLPLPIAVLAIGMIAFTVMAWRNRRGSLLGRIHYTVVALSSLAFVWWLAYWNLWIGYLR